MYQPWLTRDGARVRLSKGKITVTDGPFTEAKEVIGGWAILQTASRSEAMRIATEFMELHRKYWPEFEGESELRPMFGPARARSCQSRAEDVGSRDDAAR